MTLPCFRFSAFLLVFFLLPVEISGDITTDADALLAFKASTGNQKNTYLSSWDISNSSSICTNWEGVTCSSNDSSVRRVITLELPGRSIAGQIPPSTLGKLDALEGLNLSQNAFYGELPLDLSNCTSLRRLFLQNNNFSGPLSAVYAWPLLTDIDVSFNRFNGSIPQAVANATLLRSLNLQNNSFTGTIPAIASPSLESFNVANNELDGSIPSSLSKFSAASFSGNKGLCGEPLNSTCPGGVTTTTGSEGSPAQVSSPSSKGKLHGKQIAGIVIGSVGGACILLLISRYIARKRTKRSPSSRVFDIERVERGLEGNEEQGEADAGHAEELEELQERKLVFVDKSNREAFDLEALLRASAEVMGKGSLGTAFKAMMEDDLVVIVKRLTFVSKDDYKRRLDVLGELKHPNLVPIRAWYFSRDEKLLVYDYIHGSLYHHLYCDEARMEWAKRLQVASTVAKALSYVHAQNVVHGNVKSTNILIGFNGEAYLTDCGLVPLAVNMAVKNTGYSPPEVMGDLTKMTATGDVYSFGVLLLELLTGRSPLPLAPGGRHNVVACMDLPVWVQSVVSEQWTAEVFDLEIMKFEYIQEEMMLLLQIAMRCVSQSPDQRPSMSSLVTSIENLQCSDDEGSFAPSP